MWVSNQRRAVSWVLLATALAACAGAGRGDCAGRPGAGDDTPGGAPASHLDTALAPPTDPAVTPQIGRPIIGPVVVGARTFVESRIVAEVYAQALEGAGFAVDRQPTFDTSAQANASLVAGGIDLYPERPAAAAEHVLGLSPVPTGDDLPATVREAYALFDVEWLAPAPYRPEDPMTPVVRSEVLARYPDLAPTLERATALLTEPVMRRLTAQVERDRREPADVVRAVLAETPTPSP